MVVLEFDEDINVDLAKQKVKDEVDAVVSGEDWPTFNNAKLEPNVFDLNFVEEFPIVNVTLEGDYTLECAKRLCRIIRRAHRTSRSNSKKSIYVERKKERSR